jgi:hypothetical protein
MNQTPVYTPISQDRIAELTTMATEVDAVIHVIRRVCVRQDRDWHHAIGEAVTCCTKGYDTCTGPEVYEKFRPVSYMKEEIDIVLICYHTKIQELYRSALLDWEEKTGLQATVPREIFAIGEGHKDLRVQMRCFPGSMYLVAPIEGLIEDCLKFLFLEWTDSDRYVGVDLVDHLLTSGSWFAFREPSPEPVQ